MHKWCVLHCHELHPVNATWVCIHLAADGAHDVGGLEDKEKGVWGQVSMRGGY
jgi:hypothetical protein